LSTEEVKNIDLSRKTCSCPSCDKVCKKHSFGNRMLKEIGISHPIKLSVKYSKHYCSDCKLFFSLPMDHIARPHSRFTNRVVRTATKIYSSKKLTLRETCEYMKSEYHVCIPQTTLHDWLVEFS
jgi:hypothetical protein